MWYYKSTEKQPLMKIPYRERQERIMDRIISNMGDAVILRAERKAQDIEGWERRTGFIGFEGNLVIRASEEGCIYASIDDGRRCISTSPGRLTFRGADAVFETENSIYTFRLVSFGSTGVFDAAG